MVTTDEDLAFAEGRRGENLLTQLAFGDRLIALARLHGAQRAEVVDEIDVALSAGLGGMLPTQTLLPEDFADLRAPTVADAA